MASPPPFTFGATSTTSRQAITLGEANDTWLDLTVAENAKFYRNGMKCLEGDKYDGKPKGMRVFIESFKSKAIMYNWSDVLNVPESGGSNARNFLTNYGTVTMKECQEYATTYMLARDRAAQNSQMIYHCVSDSLTNEAKTELMSESKSYTIEGYSEGLCFLKLVLSKAQTDTIATVNVLRAAIGKLPTKIVELGGNITDFNNHVRNIQNNLLSYGESCDELLMNLFLAYGEVEDEDFVIYVKMKRSLWEEGNSILDPPTLMSNAENNYKVRVQQGNWKAPSKKDEQIAAMKALIERQGDKPKDKVSYDDKIKNDKAKNPMYLLKKVKHQQKM